MGFVVRLNVNNGSIEVVVIGRVSDVFNLLLGYMFIGILINLIIIDLIIVLDNIILIFILIELVSRILVIIDIYKNIENLVDIIIIILFIEVVFFDLGI